ncbi:MAG: nucleotidyltransferase family protein [Methanolinea sp.]|jgi:hypothetical protein
MNLYQVLTEKRGEILALAERYGVKNIHIFGSVARHEARDESDIDFLVEFPPNSTLITHAAFQRELSVLLGCPVDVASFHGLNERVRHTVAQDAIPL